MEPVLVTLDGWNKGERRVKTAPRGGTVGGALDLLSGFAEALFSDDGREGKRDTELWFHIGWGMLYDLFVFHSLLGIYCPTYEIDFFSHIAPRQRLSPLGDSKAGN